MCVFCLLLCFFNSFGRRSERKRTDFHLSASFAKKKGKKKLLRIQIYALATSPFPSLSQSLSKWHLRMTSASRVSGAEGRIEEAGGEKRRLEEEMRRKREQAPLTSYFPSTIPACQPACSLFSFELSVLALNRKKSIHISIIHTPVCLSLSLPLPPS